MNTWPDAQNQQPNNVVGPSPDAQQPDAEPTPRFAGEGLAHPEYQAVQLTSGPLTWQAAEYEQHPKGPRWLAGFGAVSIVLFGIAFLTGSLTFMALVVVMIITAGVFAFRSPQTLTYTLTEQGIQINNKPFAFHDFRAFGVVPNDQEYSAVLLPTKRFGLAVRLYFTHQNGQEIVAFLGAHLPLQEMQQDPVDKLLSRLRF